MLRPKKRDAKTTAEAIWDFWVKNGLVPDLEVTGGDSTPHNTGHKGGTFFYLQELIGHRLLISVCKLHTNELPLRHLMRSLGVRTLSANKYSGEIGEAICGNVEELPLNPGNV